MPCLVPLSTGLSIGLSTGSGCPQGGGKVVHRVWVGLWIVMGGGGGWRRVCGVVWCLGVGTYSERFFTKDLTSVGLSTTVIHMTATHIIRRTADKIGLDPWDIDVRACLVFARATEREPMSRFRWGSPCRFVRSIDVAVHVLLPGMLEEKYPELATYLRSTSPRWGRAFREW